MALVPASSHGVSGDISVASVTADTVTAGGTTLKDLFGVPAVVPTVNTDPSLVVSCATSTADSVGVFQVWDDDFNTDNVFNVFHGGNASVLENASNTNNSPTLRVVSRGTTNAFALDISHLATAHLTLEKVTGILTNLGAIATTAHAAPADGELAAGQCALWFDQSNVTPALKVKAKTENGTVVTASVLLT